MIEFKEIKISRQGIYIDGELFDKKVRAFRYEATHKHDLVQFVCYVTNGKNEVLLTEKGDDVLLETFDYIWRH